jgi:hypothetical protein
MPDDEDRRTGYERRMDIAILKRDFETETARRQKWEEKQEKMIEKIGTRVTQIWAVIMFLAAAIPIGLTVIGFMIK